MFHSCISFYCVNARPALVCTWLLPEIGGLNCAQNLQLFATTRTCSTYVSTVPPDPYSQIINGKKYKQSGESQIMKQEGVLRL